MNNTSNQERAASASPPISLLRRAEPARILLLDDVSKVRNTIIAVLSFCFEDFIVTVCSNGNEAWEKILEDPPDLLISDYTHPDLALEEIVHRSSILGREFPVILLSAVIDKFPEEERRFMAMSRVAVLHKPFTIDDLRSQVSRLLS